MAAAAAEASTTGGFLSAWHENRVLRNSSARQRVRQTVSDSLSSVRSTLHDGFLAAEPLHAERTALAAWLWLWQLPLSCQLFVSALLAQLALQITLVLIPHPDPAAPCAGDFGPAHAYSLVTSAVFGLALLWGGVHACRTEVAPDSWAARARARSVSGLAPIPVP